ncbi:MAG: hypothetical protein ACFCU1_03875 [Sumerlaeia bacterium]
MESLEASARVLLDRTTIRIDGRPFFSFGFRLLLTPPEEMEAVLVKLKEAGFTGVTSPPASPGNFYAIDRLFEITNRLGIFVNLMSDPRVDKPSEYLAERYKHHPSLLSYCIATQNGSEREFARFCRERDRLRHQDVFHPIWTPYQEEFGLRLYIDSTDIHAISHTVGGPTKRKPMENGANTVSQLFNECRTHKIPGRPFFCHTLHARVSDEVRKLGVYDFDPVVNTHSPVHQDWYPYYSRIDEDSRWDFLPPDVDFIRLRCFEMLASRVRGIMVGNYDFMLGKVPFTGMDRFHELSIIAREIEAVRDFFAEGQFVRGDLETGHPGIKASMLHHTDDILVLLWRSGKSDEFWLDPMTMPRVEIRLDISSRENIRAWSLDFPEVKPLELIRDAKGAVMFTLENFDLTSKILLTRSHSRPQEIKDSVEKLLPKAVASRKQVVEIRQQKLQLIENELGASQFAKPQRALLEEIRQLALEGTNLIKLEEHISAWQRFTEAGYQQRVIINHQMVQTIANPPGGIVSARVKCLRRSYYTLPQYYRELIQRDDQIIQEYT